MQKLCKNKTELLIRTNQVGMVGLQAITPYTATFLLLLPSKVLQVVEPILTMN